MQLNLSKRPESVLFQAVFDKKFVFGLVFIKVCPILGVYFQEKKAPRSSCLVLGYMNPRPVWVENGVCLKIRSRS